MNLFNIYKAIYQKTIQPEPVNNGILIVLNKWLSQDKDNLLVLRKIIKYLFYIEPLHYYYLLFFNIPRKYEAPYVKKIVSLEEQEPELVKKIQYELGWSTKELSYNQSILEKTVFKNSKYWREQLGLE